MKFTEIVVHKAIIPDLKATVRDDAIAELIDALVKTGSLAEARRDELTKSIIKREKHASTGFGHGVAVPHVKHAAIDKPMVAVGISKEGIDFNALDAQPVFTVFLLLSPDQPEAHLDAMEVIFNNLNRDMFRRFLRQATSVKDVTTLLEEADTKTAV